MRRLISFCLLTIAFATPVPLAGCKDTTAPPAAVISKETQVREFWEEFRAAVGSGNLEHVADMVHFPSTYPDRKKLMEDFEFLLGKEVKDRIARTDFEALEHESTAEEGERWRFDYNNGVTSEGQVSIIWDIGFVDYKIKFVAVMAFG